MKDNQFKNRNCGKLYHYAGIKREKQTTVNFRLTRLFDTISMTTIHNLKINNFVFGFFSFNFMIFYSTVMTAFSVNIFCLI